MSKGGQSVGPKGPTSDAAAGWFAPLFATLGSAALILAPVLHPGYVLVYDMVFAPRMPIGPASFGLGSQPPRAVPSDLLSALASHVLPGDLVQKLLLAALLIAAGLGAARLAPAAAFPRTAAALAYLWTPYLGERLLLGQWAVLVGYAMLPWLVGTARRVRSAGPDGRRTAWARFVFVLGVMSLGGAPSWLLALLTAPLVIAWGNERETRRRVLDTAGCLLALAVYALPWALPALLRPGGVGADPQGAQAFAPSADTPLGIVGSLFTGGGVWNSEAVPPGRDLFVPALGALLLVAIGVVGAIRSRPLGLLAPLAAAGLVGLGLALLTSWGPAGRAVARLPAGALLRDSQRLLAPWILLIALGFAAAVGELAARVRRDALPALALLTLLPVLALPALAWGVSGRLVAVDYPADFARVRTLLQADHRGGAVLVLPFDAYRRFPWNGDRTSMDPLARWLDRTVIVSSDLPVAAGGRQLVVRGEDRLAAELAADLHEVETHGGGLAELAGARGVRWVVTDAAVPPALLSGLIARHVGKQVSLYEIPAGQVSRQADPARSYAASRTPVVIGDIVAATVLVWSGLWADAGHVGRRLRSGGR